MGGSLMLPLRRMGDATGAEIKWDGANKTVYLTRPSGTAAAPTVAPPAPRATAPTSAEPLPQKWVQRHEATAQAQILFDNGDSAAVKNNPTAPTQFTLKAPARILRIAAYHWNDREGAPLGTLSITGSGGKSFGKWNAAGPENAGPGRSYYWFCDPNIVLPAGTYTIVDSDPSTRAWNEASKNAGMAQVVGHPEP